MKTSVKGLRERLNRVFKEGYKESINRERRKKRGYNEMDADVSGDVAYTDLPEGRECDLEMEEEGVSQSKRSVHGYDLEDPVDYDVPGEGLGESKKKVTEADKPKRSSLAGLQMRDPKASVAPHLQRTKQATHQLASIDDKISTLNDFVDDLVDTFGSSVDVNKVTTWLIQKAREVQQIQPKGVDKKGEKTGDFLGKKRAEDEKRKGVTRSLSQKKTKELGDDELWGEPEDAEDFFPAKEVNEPPEEPEKKRKRAMSHAAERGHKAEIPLMGEETPPGKTKRGKSYEKVVQALKQNRDVDNPWAVAWAMKKKQGQ